MGKDVAPREEEEEVSDTIPLGQVSESEAEDSDSAPEVVTVSSAKASYLTGRQGQRAQEQ